MVAPEEFFAKGRIDRAFNNGLEFGLWELPRAGRYQQEISPGNGLLVGGDMWGLIQVLFEDGGGEGVKGIHVPDEFFYDCLKKARGLLRG